MIIPAEVNHLNQILDIENLSFNNPWSKTQLMNDLNNEIAQNWVYLENNIIKGYIFGWNIEDEYHLNNIAVHPVFRKKGIAKEILTFCITNLKKEKVKTIYLEVNTRNLPAIQFYLSFGFEKMGLRKNYYGKNEDAELFSLNLEL
jgi:ribosomal-protein-alanine N-acetyltransferase